VGELCQRGHNEGTRERETLGNDEKW